MTFIEKTICRLEAYYLSFQWVFTISTVFSYPERVYTLMR